MKNEGETVSKTYQLFVVSSTLDMSFLLGMHLLLVLNKSITVLIQKYIYVRSHIDQATKSSSTEYMIKKHTTQ